ncbi:hypothetical protein IGK28_002092 [Enterococcus sp. DIV0182]|uniref:lytic polysaccharide monooxygenase auxiliary activity family 9 protein n=1 Tax=Enterococcus TaxID=1350 RepID=UPI00372D3281
MKKSTLLGLSFVLVATGLTALTTVSVDAHGYVKEPVSRGYQGFLDKNQLGWSAAHDKYGAVIDDPQSLEGKKGFPQAGPADGHIASADGVLGDYTLDKQTADRWTKHTVFTGKNNFSWTFTADHATTKWHYYITKNGWDQNKPLTRDELQLIDTIDHDGDVASTDKTHEVTIPTDHLGYHVVLAVWDIDDTPNAFYNVIDVNVKQGNRLTNLAQ